MIYLKNTSARQQVRLPYNGLMEGAETPRLGIWSTTDAREAYDAGWHDYGRSDALYLEGWVKLPKGLPDGEYEYKLVQGSQVLGSGVCQIGKYEAVPVQKGNTTIEFKQYAGRN